VDDCIVFDVLTSSFVLKTELNSTQRVVTDAGVNTSVRISMALIMVALCNRGAGILRNADCGMRKVVKG